MGLFIQKGDVFMVSDGPLKKNSRVMIVEEVHERHVFVRYTDKIHSGPYWGTGVIVIDPYLGKEVITPDPLSPTVFSEERSAVYERFKFQIILHEELGRSRHHRDMEPVPMDTRIHGSNIEKRELTNI